MAVCFLQQGGLPNMQEQLTQTLRRYGSIADAPPIASESQALSASSQSHIPSSVTVEHHAALLIGLLLMYKAAPLHNGAFNSSCNTQGS